MKSLIVLMLSIPLISMGQISTQGNVYLYADSSIGKPYINDAGKLSFSCQYLDSLVDEYNMVSFDTLYKAAYSSTDSSLLHFRNRYRVYLEDSVNIDSLNNALSAASNLCGVNAFFVENRPIDLSTRYEPNEYTDPTLSWQNWQVDDINLPEAWSLQKGTDRIRVGIVEQYPLSSDHEELINKLLEVNVNVFGSTLGHATAVAGLAVGNTDNGVGIMSAGFNTKGIFYGGGLNVNTGNVFDLTEYVLDIVINEKARVVNLSWGICTNDNDFNQFEQDFLEVISLAQSKKILLVASAGNNPTSPLSICKGHIYMYPASFDGVLSVSGIRKYGNLQHLTPPLTHNDKVDIIAPGQEVHHPSHNTSSGNTYAITNGTSWSAPIVSGIIALMLSENPCLTNDEIVDILKSQGRFIGDLHQNKALYDNDPQKVPKLVDAYQSVLYVRNQISNNTVINNSTVWNSLQVMNGDIIIEEGGTLTIESTVIMPFDRKIIVNRGGKLIVDGGLITSECEHFWTGIEVHGHADQPHYSYYATQIALGTYPVDSNDHGVVVIKNGGTIENAHVGITNVKKNNGAILTHSGGIIIAEEANFINCWKGVEMYQFRPDKTGSASNPKQNISRFTNCTFKTTSDYFHDDYPPTDFVTLWDVHDVQFSGCTFENEAYVDFIVDDRGNGITSIDATYQLKGRCTAFDTDGKCTTYQHNSFSHLTEGISYTASLGQPFITWIDRTDFTGNAIGVQAKGTHHDFRVTRSHFTLPTSASVNNRRCAGVELLGSTGFTVEDNTFEQSATLSGSESSAGIRIAVSGQKANRIYRNTFTNITNGVWADDDNRGLQIKCNTFTTGTIHKHDVIVCGNSTRDGIAKLQGLCRQDISDFDYYSAPAGNLFSQSQGVQYSDWYNATALSTTKYHHHFTSTSNDPLELVYKNNATNEECVAEYDATKACPLNPILDDGKGPNQQISELRTRMADIHTELDGAPGGDYEKYLNTERELALSEGYKLYLTHDSLYGIDSARYWLEQDTSDLAKALLVALYVQEGDYTLADQALDSITDLAYTENTGKSYLDKLITIKSTDWHYGSTDSTTLSQVAALANDSTTYGWQAYGMLASAGYLEYPVPEPPCGPGAVIGSGKRAMDTLPEAPAANTFLTLQPNPTSGGVTLTWDTQGEQIDLRVLTPQGKVVYQAQSWPGSGTKHIATPWPAGMYFIVLTGDHGKQHSTSLLLTK